MIWRELLFIGLGFLLGSVLFSYHIPLILRRVDVVKQSGDNNPGTANAMKLAGVPIGLLCLFMDMLKGFLPVFLSLRVLGTDYPLLPLVMAAPLLGHALAPMYPFRGGKCIATAFGALIGLMPTSNAAWVLVFWYLFFSLLLVLRPHERRSVYAFALFSLSCLLGGALCTHRLPMAAGCALVGLIACARNYQSLRRMEAAPPEKSEAQPSAQP